MAIQINLLNIPSVNARNGYNIEVLIDGEPKFPTELSREEMFQCGAILVNAGNRFIKNALEYERKERK